MSWIIGVGKEKGLPWGKGRVWPRENIRVWAREGENQVVEQGTG